MMNVRKKQFKSFDRFLRGHISDYELLLSILNTFIVGTEEDLTRV